MHTTTSPEARLQVATRAWGVECSVALNAIYSMWYRDVLRFSRDRSRIASSLGQPVLFLFIVGVGLSPSMGRLGGQRGINYVQFIFPGIIAMSVLFAAVFSAISTVWDREFGFLKEVLVAPVPRWAVAVGKALGGSTTAVFQGALLLLFAPLVGVGLTPLSVVRLLAVMFLIAFALSSMGLAIAARMKSVQSFPLVLNFLMMPMFFLSGALFPLGNAPAWLTVLTMVNPITYGVDAMRQIILSHAGVPADVLAQLGIGLLGHTLNLLADLSFVAAFAALMITLAQRAFSMQE
jgi:ABC-2 type transport system permease protein